MHAYRLNNVTVECVDTFKYLGVRIHPKLRWSDHITDVATKANRILNLLNNQCMVAAEVQSIKRILLLLGHIWNTAVWSPHQLKDCDRLERVQWRAARWMSGQWDPVARKWSKSYDATCQEFHMPILQ